MQRAKMLEKEKKLRNQDDERYASAQVKQLRKIRLGKTLLSKENPSKVGGKACIALCFLVVEDIPHELIWRKIK